MNSDLVKGLAIGVGIGIVAPMLFPTIARATRPGVGAAIRAGVLAWERGREKLAEFGEYAEDMVAEARAQAPVVTAAHPGAGEAFGG